MREGDSNRAGEMLTMSPKLGRLPLDNCGANGGAVARSKSPKSASKRDAVVGGGETRWSGEEVAAEGGGFVDLVFGTPSKIENSEGAEKSWSNSAIALYLSPFEGTGSLKLRRLPSETRG